MAMRSAMAADREPAAEPLASWAPFVSMRYKARAAVQHGNERGDVERIACGPIGESWQPGIGLPPTQGSHQVGHRRLGKPAEPDPDGVACRPQQGQRFLPPGPAASSRCGAGHLTSGPFTAQAADTSSAEAGIPRVNKMVIRRMLLIPINM
jgi:hypothetical protein